MNQIYLYPSTHHNSNKLIIPSAHPTSSLFNMDNYMNLNNNYTNIIVSGESLRRNDATINSYNNNYHSRSRSCSNALINQDLQSRLTNKNNMVKRSNTYNQNSLNTPNILDEYSPIRRNHTRNLSSQKKYSKINTYENFERLLVNGCINTTTNNYNNKHVYHNNNRINQLSPLQIQRNRMRSPFTFPNGEKFTPKTTHSPIEYISTNSSNITTTSNTTTTTTPTQKSYTQSSDAKSTSKKFGSFWKKLVGKDTNKTKDIPSIKITKSSLPTSTSQSVTPEKSDNLHLTGKIINNDASNNNNDLHPLSLRMVSSTDNNQDDFDSSKLIERLEESWDVVNVNSSISILNDPIIDSYISKEKRSVSFAKEIFVNDTYSPEEYHRADPENITKKDRKMVFDEEFGFIDEVKYELNQYKRKEMLIHVDSIQFIQFSR